MYKPGGIVRLSEDPGTTVVITAVDVKHAGEQYYRVYVGNREVRRAECSLLPYTDEDSPSDFLARGLVGDFSQFQQLLTFHRARRGSSFSNYYFSFNASRTRFYPHQFKPLIKFLDSPIKRVLIADEVGLGKTIEAGLILTELEARQHLDRVLIVCPSTLTQKWCWEMKNRFDQDFEIAKAERMGRFLEEFESNPDRTSARLIVSLETVRAREMLQRIDLIAPRFDLLIVDEAHHLRNPGRNQHRVGGMLAEYADAVVFLTATPIQLGRENLFSLLHLLDPQSFISAEESERLFLSNEPVVRCLTAISQIPPAIDRAAEELSRASSDSRIGGHPDFPLAKVGLERLQAAVSDNGELPEKIIDLQKSLNRINLLSHIFTRTRKRDVQDRVVVRRAYATEVTLTDIERQFYQAVTSLVRAQNARRRSVMRGSGFLLVTPQRRMSSSIPAMVEHYRQSAGLGEDEVAEDPIITVAEDHADPDQLAHARRELQKIIARWPRNSELDSKYDVFREVIERTRRAEGTLKVLVFAFYKHTLLYLQRRLRADGVACEVICGDVPPKDRTIIIERFRRGDGVEVLLSSRVGSEGLDFQFCHVLVNYDLPWNPMEIEQRIGRLDRLGQESDTIMIHNIYPTDTIEDRVMQRLHQRVNVFESSIGDLDEILGEALRSLEEALFEKELTSEEEDARIQMAARTIIERRQAVKELETEAASFIGTDLYFDEEVRRISDRHRYITEKQLHDFSRSFIQRYCPRTQFTYDFAQARGRMKPDLELNKLLNQNPEVELPREFVNPPAGGLPFTFNGQAAFADPQLTFLNIVHPVIQTMVKELEQRAETTLAHHLLLSRSKLPEPFLVEFGLPPGVYVYFVYRLSIHSARSAHTLEFVLLDPSLALAVPVSVGEIVLGRLLEHGETPKNIMTVPIDVAQEASSAARGHFLERAREIENQHRVTNDAFLERRLDVLRNHYGRLIAAKEAQLDEARRTQKQQKYIRLLEGSIRRFTQERDWREEVIEKRRGVGAADEEIAAGIIELVP